MTLADRTLRRYAELNGIPASRLQFVHMPEWIKSLCEVLECEMQETAATEPPAL